MNEISENHNTKIDFPIVSVAVITYNHEKYIAEALDSILMQKVDFKYEIVVGEDYSTDNTRKILLKYVTAYPDKIKPLLHETNTGGSANFIETLKACKGKYIALLEGDDYWTDPLKLQKQVDFMESHSEYNMIFHNAEVHVSGSSGVTIKPFNLEKKNREYTANELIESWKAHTATVLFLNQGQYSYLEDKIWSPMGDIPLFIKCASLGKVYYLSEQMSVYRVDQTGITHYEDFFGPSRNRITAKFYKVLYKDFSDILSLKTINHRCAHKYINGARASKKNENKRNYYKNLLIAAYYDPKSAYEECIRTQEQQPSVLSSEQINSIRDSAVALEKENIKLAYDLMKIAYEARPNGPFIEKKLNEYKSIIKGNDCDSEKND